MATLKPIWLLLAAANHLNEIKPWRQKEWMIPPEESSVFVANGEMVLDVYTRQ